VTLLVLAFIVTSSWEHVQQDEGKLQVVASTYILGELASHVGGERIHIIVATPTGADPHDFEPSPRMISAAYEADIFLFYGAGLDPWAERITQELREKNAYVIEMTSFFSLHEAEFDHHYKEDDHEEHVLDPHIWLDPVLAQDHIEIIRDAFLVVDQEGSSFYEQKAESYLAQLRSLDDSYEENLTQCGTRSFLMSHGAFSYLAERYNLEMIPISRLSPGQEPSPRELADIILLAREKNIHTVFFETLTSSRLSEVVAGEIEGELFPLHSLEGLVQEEVRSGESYISLMEKNLEQLRKGLSCS
jgi:zinc transport system substrate-binding protein